MVKNINKLKGKIIENGYSKKEFSKVMKMTEATLRKKINDPTAEFSLSESLLVKEKLKLNANEYIDIFFGNDLN